MDNGVALKRECSIVNAVSMESLDNCSTISSGDNQTQVRTLFVSGLPLDIKARELYLLFRSCNGYESSQLKSSTSGKNSSNSLIKPTNFPPVGFVTFATRHDAEEALNNLQGIRFDPELAQTLRLEFARSNTKVTRPKHAASSSPTANTTPNTTFLSPAAILAPSIPSINGITQEKFSFQRMQEGGSNSLVGNLLSPQLTKTGQYDTIATLSSQLSSTNQYALPLSGVELANSQLIGMQNLQKSQTHCQQIQALRQILAVSAANQQQNVIAALAHAQQQALSATILVSNNQINNAPTTATGTVLTPPCSTLFIANLGSYPNLEDELRAMFRPLPGFSRIRIHAKGGNATSVAFAEFQTVEQARVAMQRLQGRVLGNNQGSTGSRGIRIEFAKTKMADSTSSPQYNYINGLCPNGIASAV